MRGVASLGLVFAVALIAIIVGATAIVSRAIDVGCVGECLDRQDLAMQTNMALAAWAMALLTAVSAVIGAASLWLIFQTLKEARRSAQAAIEGVRQAEATAQAAQVSATQAEAALRVSQRMGELQTRAYLVATGATVRFSFEPDGVPRPVFTLTVENSGATPAQIVSIAYSAFHQTRAEKGWVNIKKAHGNLFIADLAANRGDSIEIWANMDLPLRFDQTLGEEAERLVLRGAIKYRSIFGWNDLPTEFEFRTVRSPESRLGEINRLYRVPRATSG